MQTELLDSKKWVAIAELSTDTVGYIATFHNHKLHHLSLKMMIPTEYENLDVPMLQLT